MKLTSIIILLLAFLSIAGAQTREDSIWLTKAKADLAAMRSPGIVDMRKFNPSWSDGQKQLYVALKVIDQALPPSKCKDEILQVLNDSRFKWRTCDPQLVSEMVERIDWGAGCNCYDIRTSVRMLHFASQSDQYIWFTMALETDSDDYCSPGFHLESDNIVMLSSRGPLLWTSKPLPLNVQLRLNR
jgi:hypothetical protein